MQSILQRLSIFLYQYSLYCNSLIIFIIFKLLDAFISLTLSLCSWQSLMKDSENVCFPGSWLWTCVIQTLDYWMLKCLQSWMHSQQHCCEVKPSPSPTGGLLCSCFTCVQGALIHKRKYDLAVIGQGGAQWDDSLHTMHDGLGTTPFTPCMMVSVNGRQPTPTGHPLQGSDSFRSLFRQGKNPREYKCSLQYWQCWTGGEGDRWSTWYVTCRLHLLYSHLVLSYNSYTF